MPFGKFKGRKLFATPSSYLGMLSLSLDETSSLKKNIDIVLAWEREVIQRYNLFPLLESR